LERAKKNNPFFSPSFSLLILPFSSIGDQEQVENKKAAPVLKRLPSKSIKNDTDAKKAKEEGEEEASVDPAERRLQQRNKQISIGKATIGYQRYVAEVPLAHRKPRNEKHPVTPDAKQGLRFCLIPIPISKFLYHVVCSKRSWEGQMKVWRRRLHFYTPSTEGAAQEKEEEFYEGKEEEDRAPTASELRPLPDVVPVEVEPMQLNGENSLLGEWEKNSLQAMELQGDSCVPQNCKEEGEDEEEILFIPFQYE